MLKKNINFVPNILFLIILLITLFNKSNFYENSKQFFKHLLR